MFTVTVHYIDWTPFVNHVTFIFLTVVQDNKGEMIIISNVSRYCDDIYECVADNGVPPAVSRQMRVTVECKYFMSSPITIISYINDAVISANFQSLVVHHVQVIWQRFKYSSLMLNTFTCFGVRTPSSPIPTHF